jgi:hypothetical protein
MTTVTNHLGGRGRAAPSHQPRIVRWLLGMLAVLAIAGLVQTKVTLNWVDEVGNGW